MGTSGLVGQIMTINTMGASLNTWLLIMMFHFVLPAFVTFVIYRFMIKRQWLHVGEQKIQLNQ